MTSAHQILMQFITQILQEEFIGNKGGVNYYQMGGSIKREELYNLDTKGKPTREPGVPGLKKFNRHQTKSRKKKNT